MKNEIDSKIKHMSFRRIWPYFVIFTVALIYAIPQLHVRGIYVGADSAFHFNRAFEAMERIKNFNFHNTQMSLYGFNKSGRVVNALYGPGLGYFFGIILLLTKSWLKFQLITNFILTIGSIGLSYWLFNKYSKQPFLSLVFAIVLSLTSPWSISYWYQSSGGMPWGMMFMPLVIDAGIQMYSNREKPVRILRLGVIMALILESHMLSFVFGISILSVFFIAGMITNPKRLQLFKQSVVAATISLGLTLGYWSDYISIVHTQNILSPFVNLNPANLSSNIFQGLNFWLIVLSVTLIISFSGKLQNWQWIVFVTGIGFLIVASGPKFILEHWNNIGFLRTVQFPMRFTLPGVYLLSFFVVTMLSRFHDKSPQNKSYIIAIAVGVLLVSGSTIKNSFLNYYTVNQKFWQNPNYVTSKFSTSRNITQTNIKKILENRNDDFEKSINVVNFSAPDYLPGRGQVYYEDANYRVIEKEIINPRIIVKKSLSKTGNLVVKWHQHKTHVTNLPIIVYRQSVVKLNGYKITPEKNNNGVLKVIGNSGLNTVEVGIKVPKMVQIAKLGPIVVSVVVVGILINSKRKR